MAKPNYGFAKRQRELAKQQKKDEKKRRKEEAAGQTVPAPAEGEAGTPPATPTEE